MKVFYRQSACHVYPQMRGSTPLYAEIRKEWSERSQAIWRAQVFCITAADTVCLNRCYSRQITIWATLCQHPCTGSPHWSNASTSPISANVPYCSGDHRTSPKGDTLQDSANPSMTWGNPVTEANSGHKRDFHLSNVIAFFVSIPIFHFDGLSHWYVCSIGRVIAPVRLIRYEGIWKKYKVAFLMPLRVRARTLQLHYYLASFSNVNCCTWSICSSGDLEIMTISSIFTSAIFHLTEDTIMPFSHWNVPGVELGWTSRTIPFYWHGVLIKRCSPW